MQLLVLPLVERLDFLVRLRVELRGVLADIQVADIGFLPVDIAVQLVVGIDFQLVAVLFQLQSLQQFGGVSASHLDWTMVPYVRMSYYKHYKDVVDIIPFIKKNPTIENPRETSILDEEYRGKHWYNFIKRYTAMKASRLTNKELKQAVEGMMHNLNIWATQQ